MSPKRIPQIDAVRGVAIVMMVLANLGQASLFMYLFHLIVIGRFILEKWESLPVSSILGIFGGLVFVMWLVSCMLGQIRSKAQIKFLPIRMLLGS